MPLVNLPLLYPAVLAQSQRAQESEREQGQRALQALFEWQREGYTWYVFPFNTQHSTPNTQHPTPNPQPSTLNPQPSTLNPQH